ncbi:MAG TPA: hypothetical protein VKB59_03475 [Micromonosporaceae bacterium]|nr:hypothetical protein [Micromonosporaceae bacterium]
MTDGDGTRAADDGVTDLDVPAGERVIDLDVPPDRPEVTRRRRRVTTALPVLIALMVGAVIGYGAADVRGHRQPAPAPAPRMHTVVVTEDGRSQTFTMPSGSVVTTPAVVSSCSITIDGKFADFISRVVGNAECGATVP